MLLCLGDALLFAFYFAEELDHPVELEPVHLLSVLTRGETLSVLRKHAHGALLSEKLYIQGGIALRHCRIVKNRLPLKVPQTQHFRQLRPSCITQQLN